MTMCCGPGRLVRTVNQRLNVVLHILVLYLSVSLVMGTKLCQKRVPVPSASKKVSVLRRVPASCSNWEKAWSWITHKDCGTKYRFDTVELPSQDQVTYRMESVCCEGDISCEDDEKFLAIVLGSTAAALFVVILIICISLCRKKKQCSLLCEERRHIYASAEEDESSELQGQKEPHLSDEETENKVCEPVYAEISDNSGLPRYTDIFKESGGEEDPFMRATAPPLYDDSRMERVTHVCEADDTNVKEVLQGTADILEKECQEGKGKHSQRESDDKEYYNVVRKPATSSASKGEPVREEAVMSLTKDDPAVVSSASPPSPTSPKNLPQKTNTACDASGHQPSPTQDKSASDQKCSAYEQLAHNADKDSHEYQKLSKDPCTKKVSVDEDSNVAPEKDVCVENGVEDDVEADVQIAVNGHVESTAEC